MPVSFDDMNFATGIAIFIAIIAIIVSPLALIIAGIIYNIRKRKKERILKKEYIITPEMKSEVNYLRRQGLPKEEAIQLVMEDEKSRQLVEFNKSGMGEELNFWGWFRVIITITASVFTTLFIIFYIITLFLG